MGYLLQAAVLMLMVSVGMSLDARQLVANWRRLTPSLWLRLAAATFLLPPLLAVAITSALPIPGPLSVGLILIAIIPGAPLMTRGAAQKGFDLQIAASYQVWSAVLTPIFTPMLVWAIAAIHGREIWVPPSRILSVIAQQQLLPFAIGMLMTRFLPGFSQRVRRVLTPVGNALLAVVIVAVLVSMGPALVGISKWVFLAAPLLAVGCLAFVLMLAGRRTAAVKTLAICNANRHVGLAILLAGRPIQDDRPVPAIIVYALTSVLVMWLYAKMARPARETAAIQSDAAGP